jgi:N-formylglutamate amidohydrolase
MIQKRTLKLIIFTLLLLVQYTAYSQTYVPGNTYFGRNNYTEYIAGNLPIIISAPHGGALTPSEIPDRTCGTETVTDSFTANLVKEIRDAIYQITGCYPHIIINNLKRIKLDANRDIGEAACGNQYAETAWNEFQNFIDSAKASVTRKSGKGLYIDIHGHGHTIQRLELGYMLTGLQLSYSDATLNLTTYKDYSSMRNLIYFNATNLTHAQLLHGSFSLGQLFAAKGFPSVPSADDPYPQSGQTYFTGGYNTERHGSKTAGKIDGIQIECNQDVRFNEPARLDFASKTAVVFLDYLTRHYFPQLAQTYCTGVGIEQTFTSKFLLFPNPFENVLYFQNSIPTDLIIYDFQGRLVFSKKIGAEDKIELNQLKNGIYLVRMSSNGKILHTEKLIKDSN